MCVFMHFRVGLGTLHKDILQNKKALKSFKIKDYQGFSVGALQGILQMLRICLGLPTPRRACGTAQAALRRKRATGTFPFGADPFGFESLV